MRERKPAAGRGRVPRRAWVIAAAGAGVFMLNLDIAVTVALPTIATDLNASSNELIWVIGVYLLSLAALVITMGRLGDTHGRREMYVVGLGLFTLGSIGSGIAWDAASLIAARALQGIGAATIQALSLALIADVYEPEERGLAIGLWTTMNSLGVALGPVVGGIVSQELDWRLIFFCNVPVSIAAAVVLLAAVRHERPQRRGERIDLPGVALSTLGLTLIMAGFIEGREWGWGSPLTIGVFAAGLALLAGFVALELRRRAPMVDIRLLKRRGYLAANFGFVITRCSYYPVLLLVPLYLQAIGGLSPAQTGLAMLPMVVTIVVLSPVVGREIGRISPATLVIAGLLTTLVSLVVLTQVDPDTPLLAVLPALLAFGASTAAWYTPMSTVGMNAVPAEEVGSGSGLLAMVRYVSGALAIAVSGALFEQLAATRISPAIRETGLEASTADTATKVIERAASGTPPGELPDAIRGGVDTILDEVLTFAFSTTMTIIAIITLLGTLVLWRLLRERGRPAPDPAAE